MPVGTTARVEVPLQGDHRLRATTGARLVRVDDRTAVHDVGSGRWTFRVR
ncbi:hypothetical protein [Umezawaea sp.]